MANGHPDAVGTIPRHPARELRGRRHNSPRKWGRRKQPDPRCTSDPYQSRGAGRYRQSRSAQPKPRTSEHSCVSSTRIVALACRSPYAGTHVKVTAVPAPHNAQGSPALWPMAIRDPVAARLTTSDNTSEVQFPHRRCSTVLGPSGSRLTTLHHITAIPRCSSQTHEGASLAFGRSINRPAGASSPSQRPPQGDHDP